MMGRTAAAHQGVDYWVDVWLLQVPSMHNEHLLARLGQSTLHSLTQHMGQQVTICLALPGEESESAPLQQE
jgi:hypothetical protein